MATIARTSEERRDGAKFSISVHYGVASFLSWSKIICNLKMGITSIKGPP
jgi:hypothetical protein